MVVCNDRELYNVTIINIFLQLVAKVYGGYGKMTAKGKQAWKYIVVLNNYAKIWNESLEDLIHILVDSMTADNLLEERTDFIEGLIEVKNTGRIVGNIGIIKCNKNDLDCTLELENIQLNKFYRKWYWIKFGASSEDKNNKFNMEKISLMLDKFNNNSIIQCLVNVLIPIVSFIIAVIEFLER